MSSETARPAAYASQTTATSAYRAPCQGIASAAFSASRRRRQRSASFVVRRLAESTRARRGPRRGGRPWKVPRKSARRAVSHKRSPASIAPAASHRPPLRRWTGAPHWPQTEMIAGRDFDVVRGSDLVEFKALLDVTDRGSVSRAAHPTAEALQAATKVLLNGRYLTTEQAALEYSRRGAAPARGRGTTATPTSPRSTVAENPTDRRASKERAPRFLDLALGLLVDIAAALDGHERHREPPGVVTEPLRLEVCDAS
jgi:hypothetical protein